MPSGRPHTSADVSRVKQRLAQQRLGRMAALTARAEAGGRTLASRRSPAKLRGVEYKCRWCPCAARTRAVAHVGHPGAARLRRTSRSKLAQHFSRPPSACLTALAVVHVYPRLPAARCAPTPLTIDPTPRIAPRRSFAAWRREQETCSNMSCVDRRAGAVGSGRPEVRQFCRLVQIGEGMDCPNKVRCLMDSRISRDSGASSTAGSVVAPSRRRPAMVGTPPGQKSGHEWGLAQGGGCTPES